MTRTVLVTGASRGIGRAVAARFADAGDAVVITARDADAVAATARELDVRGIACDGTDAEQVGRLAAEVGVVDVLVNNAGGNTDLTGDEPQTLAEVRSGWLANLESNVLSAVLTTTAVPLADDAAIVNVSSIGAEHASSSYGAAKAAVAAWTAGVSAELGARGVRCNAVSPGLIEGTEFFHGRLSDERRAALVAATHVKRAGAVEDIAETVFFLASPQARHITGQTVHVNGGAFTTR